MPSLASTDEGLRPIPAPTTAPGDPDGHHEIPEPNFSVTVPCRGCSPVIEISVTGWGDVPSQRPTQPAAEQQETKSRLPQVTITAGPSNVVVKPQPSGGGFVIGDSTTVAPGETVIVDNTPIVIRTSSGRTEVIVGTQPIPITPAPPAPANGAPDQPTLLPITIGSQTLTPLAPTNSPSDPNSDPSDPDSSSPQSFILDSQTITAGGPAITISGTTYSLLPSATALVVNGATTTLPSATAYGNIYTTTALPPITLFNTVYTANRAGYYSIAPGTTLVPGGSAITVSGTVLSLEPRGTAVVVQGSTSFMQPVTTIVTLTSGDAGTLPYPTGKPNAGVGVRSPVGGGQGLLESVFLLVCLSMGWLAVRL